MNTHDESLRKYKIGKWMIGLFLISLAIGSILATRNSPETDNPDTLPVVEIQGELIEPEVLATAITEDPQVAPETDPVEVANAISSVKQTAATGKKTVSPASLPGDTTSAEPGSAKENALPALESIVIEPETPQTLANTTESFAASGAAQAEETEDDEAAAAREPEIIEGYRRVSFEKLASFEYEVPLDPVTNKVEISRLNVQIPDGIKTLDEKPIALKGFMLPLKVENGRVTELLVMRDQSMCCYGTVPKINEWVNIRMTGEGVEPIMDQPVTLLGKLKVGEVLENGYLVGIFEMEGDKMIGPLDL